MRTQRLFIVLLVGLAACSQKPVVTFEVLTPEPAVSATPWVEGTQMALGTPTPWVEGTQTALAQTAPTYTPIVVEIPPDFSPILYGGKLYDMPFFLLLGGVSRDQWYAPDVSITRFGGELMYSLQTLEQESKYFVRGKTPEFQRTCKTYTIGTDAALDEAGVVAVLDHWNITKRAVTELFADGSENGQFYQQVVLDWLTAEGVSVPKFGVMQIFRVDIEGDGTDEIFISATRLNESQHTTQAGDYSIILMRKVQGNDTVTKLVAGDVYDSRDLEITYPRTYSLANFIDLNQDGVLEAVVGFEKWEGFGAAVYQIDGENVSEVLKAEC